MPVLNLYTLNAALFTALLTLAWGAHAMPWEQQLKQTRSALEENTSVLETLQEEQQHLTQTLTELKQQDETLRETFGEAIAQTRLQLMQLLQQARQPAWLQTAYHIINPGTGMLKQQLVQGQVNTLQQQRNALVNVRENYSSLQKQEAALATHTAVLNRQQASLQQLEQKLQQLLALPHPASATALQKEIRTLAEQSGIAESSNSTAPIPPSPLPVAGGTVIIPYGSKSPGGGTHGGLTIQAAPRSPVYAQAAGEVIYSGAFRTYGYLVILRHDAQTHTLYGGLQNSPYKTGEGVAAGAELGKLTPQVPAQLYFELRRSGKPSSPYAWLHQQQKTTR